MKDPAAHLPARVLEFVRLLRAAGMPVGPGQAIDALAALAAVDVTSRDDFYWALHAALVRQRSESVTFAEAFRMFFRQRRPLEEILYALLPKIDRPHRPPPAQRRIAEAMAPPRRVASGREERRADLDVTMTWSDSEVLRHRDFDQMTVEEEREARRLIGQMRLPIRDVRTRRFRPDPRGQRVDLRATLRASLRSGPDDIPLRFRSQSRRPPPLVLLCDISGSMERYSRMLLAFMHAVANDRHRVSSFVFGTRLTNVTRDIARRDVDEALARVGAHADDWGGGTRIAACLRAFNLRWSRRVLGQGAVVLLITDGLERDTDEALSAEMERLRLSCRRLIWLNPLLRYAGFEPRAQGVKAMLPHVDEMRPVHDLVSLEQLVDALSGPAPALRSRPVRKAAAGTA